VGSSGNLHARLASYFQPARRRRRKERSIVRASAQLEVRTRPSAFHALLEEIALIQALAPPWNRRAKAPERYSYLWVETQEDFPRLCLVAEPPPVGRCFGPFALHAHPERALDAIADAFRLRTCAGTLRPDPNASACWRARVKLCTAPCLGKISPGEYGRLFAVADSGQRSLAALERRRDELVACQRFESAARAQKRLAALVRLRATLRPLCLAAEHDYAMVLQPGTRPGSAALWAIAGGRVLGHVEGRPPELRAAFDALCCRATAPRAMAKAEVDAARAVRRWLRERENRKWTIRLRGNSNEAVFRRLLLLAERVCAPPAQMTLPVSLEEARMLGRSPQGPTRGR